MPTTAISSRWRRSPPARACRRSASTPCSTAATPRPARRARSSRTSRSASRPRTRTRGSRRSAAATGRWTATTAGTGRSAATTRSSTAWASTPASPLAAIDNAYARGENDEFVLPTVIDSVNGRVRDGDPIVHANFRADRARQLTHALADANFTAFDRGEAGPVPHDLLVVTMTEYEAGLPVEVAFPPEEAYSLAHAASDAGWRQFHVAETEKYAHVTYFFNGGREAPLPGEDRLLIPSPKVATYDLQPSMSADGVADALVHAIESDDYDLIVANFANPDMVGHTGVWDATVAALRTIDACLGRVAAALAGATRASPTAPGRCSSSPPTTATPTSCATRTACP
jgi:bisphosphoglycerate-independent phosphoglycerate mutase